MSEVFFIFYFVCFCVKFGGCGLPRNISVGSGFGTHQWVQLGEYKWELINEILKGNKKETAGEYMCELSQKKDKILRWKFSVHH